MSGDPSAMALHRALVRTAGKPYARMLVAWVRTGKLDDPYAEFCVKESSFLNRTTLADDYIDQYWERRYTVSSERNATQHMILTLLKQLRDGSTQSGPAKQRHMGVPGPRTPEGRLPGGACIPPLLEMWKHKVLLSGKYINVLQECGAELKIPPQRIGEELTMDDEKYVLTETLSTE